MNPPDTPPHAAQADMPEMDAEARLRKSREALRQRLTPPSGGAGPAAPTRLAAQLAGDWIRRYPRIVLPTAVAAGIWLVYSRPWRLLASPVLTGLLARQALALSLSSGKRLLGGLLAPDRRDAERLRRSDTSRPDSDSRAA